MTQVFEKVSKDIQIYPEAFKRKVIEEYLAGGVSKMDLLRKYGIKTKSGIQRWMYSLGYIDPYAEVATEKRPKFSRVTQSCMPSNHASTSSSDEVATLQQKVTELQRALQDERLRSEAYLRMIELAEKELHIAIRKKPFTR
jgi:transposase